MPVPQESKDAVVDRLEMLFDERQPQFSERADPELLIEPVTPSSPEARDAIEWLIQSMPREVTALLVLMALIFLSGYVVFLFIREIERVWNEDGFLVPVLKLLITAFFLFVAWCMLWALVPHSFTAMRNWSCAIAAGIGLLCGLKFLSDKARRYVKEVLTALRLRRVIEGSREVKTEEHS